MTPAILDQHILEQAAEWLVLLQSGEISPSSHQAFEAWRQQSLQHDQAWQRAERLLTTFEQVPVDIGHHTLQRLHRQQRRKLIHGLGLLLAAGPGAWIAYKTLPWQDWQADYHTATGEQHALQLADGTTLILNTATSLDIRYTPRQRELILHHGEILIETGHQDPAQRPFIVSTPHGKLTALGTRFNVRNHADHTLLGVFEGAVRIELPQRQTSVIHHGEQTIFNANSIQGPQTLDPALALWNQGMLLAQDMRMGDLVAELSRYRSGIMRCHPAIQDMRVSGAFPLLDSDASLELLKKTLPIQIHSMTRYWVSIEPLQT